LAGLSVGGDSQGVDRLFGALSAHMWPGMVLKSGNKVLAPSLPERQGSKIFPLLMFLLCLFSGQLECHHFLQLLMGFRNKAECSIKLSSTSFIVT